MKIIATVISYRRLEFLKKTIYSLQNQSLQLDKIIVINNGGEDEVFDWLKNKNGLIVVTQDNLGSSGGQYRAFEEVLKYECDWVWTMDDDVVPELDCLEKLCKYLEESTILAPIRLTPNEKIFFNDTIKFNLVNPFRNLWQKIFSESDLPFKKLHATGLTFEGPIFPKRLIQEIGFPEKNFFIYGDDSEYFIRAEKIGYKLFLIFDAKLQRLLDAPNLNKEFSWKNYYVIRNTIAIDVLHGNIAVRLLRPFFYFISWLIKSKKYEDYKITIKAFLDGYFYKSSN